MKIQKSKITELNTREFNELSEDIADSLYRQVSEIRDLYDIHINYIDDAWQIDFVPIQQNFPVIKVDTYIEYDDSNNELLMLTPTTIDDFPDILKLKNEAAVYNTCSDYIALFEFIMSLYAFEYRLS